MAEASFNNPESTICQYFLNSICRYGDKCRFSHHLSTPPRDGMCKFYLRGKCRFGDNCWNRHAPDENNLPPTHSLALSRPSPPKMYSEPLTSPSRPNGHLLQLQNRLLHGNEAQRPRDPAWTNASEFIPSTAFIDPVPQLCSDFIEGNCAAGYGCDQMHGDLCGLCHKPCLNPLDAAQRRQHAEFCKKEAKRQRDMSNARRRGVDMSCGICLDVVVEKVDPTQRKFGILENCNHIFCFECIMKWRKVKNRSRDIESFVDPSLGKACPECRTSSDFVTPSKFWFDTQEEKKKLITDRKAYLLTKHCKAFKRGDGHCPHGSLCYNLHVLPNGQKVTLPPPTAFDSFHPRELDFMSRLLLMDFWDVPDDIFSDSDFEDEELEDLDLLYNLDFEILNRLEF